MSDRNKEVVRNPNVEFILVQAPRRARMSLGERLLVLLIGGIAFEAIRRRPKPSLVNPRSSVAFPPTASFNALKCSSRGDGRDG